MKSKRDEDTPSSQHFCPGETLRRKELVAWIRTESRTAWAKDRMFRLGIGLVLLVLGTVLLFVLSVPSTDLPGLLGSLAAILLALGSLVLGTTTSGRSV